MPGFPLSLFIRDEVDAGLLCSICSCVIRSAVQVWKSSSHHPPNPPPPPSLASSANCKQANDIHNVQSRNFHLHTARTYPVNTAAPRVRMHVLRGVRRRRMRVLQHLSAVRARRGFRRGSRRGRRRIARTHRGAGAAH
jgi:hypothetical protein